MEVELPNKTDIKLIATDLDGTLLNTKGKITEKTKSVIREILEKYPEIHFVMATGRTRLATMKIRDTLGIINRPNTESINNNGCNIYDSYNKIIWENTLPNEYVIKFYDLLKSYPESVHRYTYGNSLLTISKKWEEKNRKLIQGNIFFEDREEHIRKIKSGEKSDINKVGYVYKGSKSEKILEQLEELRKEYNLESTHPSPVVIEYLPPQTNKGTSLTRLIEHLNIKKEEVIAFGDGGNDLEFLQSAGWPVAVKNACKELKPFAKIITKSNKEDGVAYILEKIFLNK